ncbi:hypothetical protein MAA_07589 [Metarhizium robertsii ARSEF 23]|uniref:Uncharacterized protein n=1 Tax=Metarhizium robertsii (strain ARSEF 23 / ATCC MYA-3075) TaxID=655844 RepID=E9F5P0_METRA|nr:uncharacterized protein MAA_07589 [Metarhizium robertsii ARSEF 23]EFY97043.2 hypothetical protein MAA_07589 [Metarhizium robertsii ARSEF 23]
MAPVFTPHWKKDSGPLSPTNWIFYAVSEIHGHYHPLSVWCEENPSELHAGRQDDSWRGRGLISSYLRTVSIFSNPNHRRAIQNELNMAKSFYQNPEHLLQPTFQLPHPSKSHPTSTQDDHWQAMPPSLAYFDQELPYGMVVIDITDQTRKMELEDDRQRVALSGSDYIIRFGYEEAENMQRFYVTCPELQLLEKVPVVDACVFNVIWPITPRTLHSVLPIYGPSATEVDGSIVHLVESALRRDEVDVSQFSPIRNLDHFQETLRSILPEMLRHSSASGVLGQLLGLAFDGCEHLDMVDFKSLSAEAVDAALSTKELSGVKEISLSAEMLNETGTSNSTPTDLADTAQCSNIENIYVMCEPELGRDRRLAKQRQSVDYLAKLLSKMEEISGSVFLSAMYSAAICKTLWFPEHYQPSYNRLTSFTAHSSIPRPGNIWLWAF